MPHWLCCCQLLTYLWPGSLSTLVLPHYFFSSPAALHGGAEHEIAWHLNISLRTLLVAAATSTAFPIAEISFVLNINQSWFYTHHWTSPRYFSLPPKFPQSVSLSVSSATRTTSCSTLDWSSHCFLFSWHLLPKPPVFAQHFWLSLAPSQTSATTKNSVSDPLLCVATPLSLAWLLILLLLLHG